MLTAHTDGDDIRHPSTGRAPMNIQYLDGNWKDGSQQCLSTTAPRPRRAPASTELSRRRVRATAKRCYLCCARPPRGPDDAAAAAAVDALDQCALVRTDAIVRTSVSNVHQYGIVWQVVPGEAGVTARTGGQQCPTWGP